MNKKIKLKYIIERVEELPPPKRKLRESIYDEIIQDVLNRPKGFYRIEIEGKPLKVMYAPLNKRIVERKLPLKLRIRSGELFIEKLS
ncbi:MAG: hypothetical protein QXH03_03550 [Candidatus Bathyarchaeia archaeon]